MELLQTVRMLADIPGVSGDEGAVRAELQHMLTGHCQMTVDPAGNLLAFKKGRKAPKNQLMLSAHMDEVGFIITHIEESGLLRFAACGGIDSRVVVGKSVEIGEKRVYGVIGVKAVHQTEKDEEEQPLKLDALYIDIGAESAGQAREHVQIGARAVFHAPFQQLGGGKIMGRAFDDRAGCAVLAHLARCELEYDCTFAFTTQEETGCTGAIAAAYNVRPDFAIIVETTTASDIAGVAPDKVVCKLGAGPVISFMDKGTIYDNELYRLGMATAERLGIPAQTKEGVYGGNESRSVQTSRGGVRVMGVSMPCRYIHSPSNVLQADDIENTLRLLEALARELGEL